MGNQTVLPYQPSQAEVDTLIELTEFMLQFSRVERSTYHPDGLRRETDADHTVVLAVIACAFAQQHRPDLDLGLVAQLAIAHDLPEGLVGDTPTLGMSPADLQLKAEREHQAELLIEQQFGSTYPWIHQMIQRYEALDTPEANYVKMIDKIMPSLTHILNGGRTFRDFNTTKESLIQASEARTQYYLDSFGADQPEVMAIREVLRQMMMASCFD